MKHYFTLIAFVQEFLIAASVVILAVLPAATLLMPDFVYDTLMKPAFALSLAAVTFVMMIRPLADLAPGTRWVRPLVILRKGFGVLSASIIVSFMLARLINMGPLAYFAQYADPGYWTLHESRFFAHIADVVAVPLLITSNGVSKFILGRQWKRLQQLAYVYFYAGALYEALALGSVFATGALIGITILVPLAYSYKHNRPAL